ncbi:MAG TPA: sigma-54 dependent transcriptional regulator [Methylomirabilota bacterium]|nr:sigma-54 dependent transcriptional regulator [Methylomirabilota bacterium]
MSGVRILVADDEPSIRWLLERVLRQAGHSVTVVEDGASAVARARTEPFDLAFLDVRMPGLDGLEALTQLRQAAPDTAVIVMTAHGSVRAAVEAMQRGAYDYLAKPFDNDEVRLLVARAVEAKALAREVVALRTGIQEVWEFGALVGKSPRMQEVYKTIGRIAGTEVTVLLRGESGTGKEVVARAIHHYSRRAGKPFVAVSCAAIPATLLESELFGHERGAFTDAHQRRLGKFELAQGGTLYLDEVGDLGAELQPKLLRVLQEREFERVGGGDPVRVDVRVVAATNRDLEALIREGQFREDLYYRLNVVPLTLPALRERPEDVPSLVDHFLAKYAPELGERAVAAEALDRLTGYGWPGNVRELENVIQHAMVMAAGGVILPEHLPIAAGPPPPPVMAGTLEQLVQQKLAECVRGLGARESANLYDLVLGLVERPLLRAVLRETGGNQLRAAALLGINRNTLRKKLRALGLRGEGDDDRHDTGATRSGGGSAVGLP